MADLDTRSKRASSLQILLAFLAAPILPDGAIDQGDRQHAALSYSGILAGGAAPPAPPVAGGIGRWHGALGGYYHPPGFNRHREDDEFERVLETMITQE